MGYKRRKKSIGISAYLNFLSANPTKWSNTVKQFLGSLPTNCLSLFDHFVKLALKGLRVSQNIFCLSLSVCLCLSVCLSVCLAACLSLSLSLPLSLSQRAKDVNKSDFVTVVLLFCWGRSCKLSVCVCCLHFFHCLF